MKVIEPGHIYQVNTLDGEAPNTLIFVNREETPHPGTQTQEIIRVLVDMAECLVDRTNHCDDCLRWEGNDKIVKELTNAQRSLRRALLFHEQRVQEREMDQHGWKPETVATQTNGHFALPSEA